MCGFVPGVNGPELDAEWPPAELFVGAPKERVLHGEHLADRVLLAIDTALGTSVAIAIRDQIFEVTSDDARGHAEAIGDLIARALSYADVAASAVTEVVVGVGPGPFTGLRVGIAAASAFATGRGVPLLPLLSPEAVARAVLDQDSSAKFRVVQDAKRRELFVTDYTGLDWVGLPVRSADPRLELRETFERVENDIWPERIPAGRLAQLAARRLASEVDFEQNRALYLRAPDVKPAAAVKRVSA